MAGSNQHGPGREKNNGVKPVPPVAKITKSNAPPVVRKSGR